MASEVLFDATVCSACDELYITEDGHYCLNGAMDVDLSGKRGECREGGEKKQMAGVSGPPAGPVASFHSESNGRRGVVCGRYGLGDVRYHGSVGWGRHGCQWNGCCHECGAYESYDGHCMCRDDVSERDLFAADSLLWRSGVISFGGLVVGPDDTTEDPTFREDREVEIVEGELYGLGIASKPIDIPGARVETRCKTDTRRPQPPYRNGYCYLWCFDQAIVDKMWEEVDLPECAKMYEIMALGQQYPFSDFRLQIVNVGKNHYHFEPTNLPGARTIREWIVQMLTPGGLFSKAAKNGYFGRRSAICAADGGDDATGSYGDTFNESADALSSLAWYKYADLSSLMITLAGINFSVQTERDRGKAALDQLTVWHPFAYDKRFPASGIYVCRELGPYASYLLQIGSGLSFKEDGGAQQGDRKPGTVGRDRAPTDSGNQAIDPTITWDFGKAKVQFEKGVSGLQRSLGARESAFGRKSFEGEYNLIWS